MSAPTATECIRGHEFTEANTYWRPGPTGPRRYCRECRRIRNREYDARKRRQELTKQPGVVVLTGPAEDTPSGDYTNAKCRDADLDAFFLRDKEPASPVPQRMRNAAASYCANCSIRHQCDEEATKRREPGLWAGKLRYRPSESHNYHLINLLAVGGES